MPNKSSPLKGYKKRLIIQQVDPLILPRRRKKSLFLIFPSFLPHMSEKRKRERSESVEEEELEAPPLKVKLDKKKSKNVKCYTDEIGIRLFQLPNYKPIL